MRNRPLVSVIVPIFNGSAWVAQALASICQQSHSDVEIIVADDASSDESLDVAAEAVRAHRGPVRILETTTNLGPGPNVARAIAAASGEWVCTMSHDDVLAPQHLSVMLEVAQREAADVVSGYGRIIDEQGNRLAGNRTPPLMQRWSREETFALLWSSNFVFGPGAIVRRSAFDALDRYPDYYTLGDWAVWIQLAERHKFASAPVAVDYRIVATSLSRGSESHRYSSERRALMQDVVRRVDLARLSAAPTRMPGRTALDLALGGLRSLQTQDSLWESGMDELQPLLECAGIRENSRCMIAALINADGLPASSTAPDSAGVERGRSISRLQLGVLARHGRNDALPWKARAALATVAEYVRCERGLRSLAST